MKTAEDWFQEGLAALERSRGADRSSEYREDLEEAVQKFDQALGVELSHPGALRERGVVLAQLGRHEEALDSFVAAAGRLPADAELQLAVGKSLAKLELFDRALGVFEVVLGLRPGDDEALVGRAEALTALGRDELALAAWDDALAVLETRKVPHRGKWIRDLTDDYRATLAKAARQQVRTRLAARQ